jgi:hypothetical protein
MARLTLLMAVASTFLAFVAWCCLHDEKNGAARLQCLS